MDLSGYNDRSQSPPRRPRTLEISIRTARPPTPYQERRVAIGTAEIIPSVPSLPRVRSAPLVNHDAPNDSPIRSPRLESPPPPALVHLLRNCLRQSRDRRQAIDRAIAGLREAREALGAIEEAAEEAVEFLGREGGD